MADSALNQEDIQADQAELEQQLAAANRREEISLRRAVEEQAEKTKSTQTSGSTEDVLAKEGLKQGKRALWSAVFAPEIISSIGACIALNVMLFMHLVGQKKLLSGLEIGGIIVLDVVLLILLVLCGLILVLVGMMIVDPIGLIEVIGVGPIFDLATALFW